VTADQNRATALEFFDQAWVKADLSAYDRYVDPAMVLHLAGYAKPFVGRDAAVDWVRTYHSAFPRIDFTIEAVLADGDHVALRWHSEQRHEGVYLGIKPLGTLVRMTALQMFRIANGKIAEVWIMFDPLNVMQQLGVLPAGLMPKPMLAVVNTVRRVRNRS
jgi:predicted ester cyclase